MKRNARQRRFSRRAVLSGAATGILSGCLNLEQTKGSGNQPEESTTAGEEPTPTKEQTTTKESVDIPAPSGEWPQFRADAQNSGYSRSSLGFSFPQVEILNSFGSVVSGITVGDPYLYIQVGGLVAFDVEEREVAWKVKSQAPGEPVYNDGTVYTMAGPEGRGPAALDAKTGATIWTRPHNEVSSGGCVLTPDGNLLVASHDAAWLLNPDDGSTIWHSKVSLGDFPVVTSNRVVGAPTNGSTVSGIDLGTGETVWTEEVGARIPHRVTAGGGRVFVGSLREEAPDVLVALSAATGDRKWTVKRDNHAMHPPAVFEDSIVVGGKDGFRSHDINTGDVIWKKNFDMATPTGEPVVDKDWIVDGYHMLNRETGDREWSLQNIRIEEIQSISLADGVAFGGTYPGILFALV